MINGQELTDKDLASVNGGIAWALILLVADAAIDFYQGFSQEYQKK
jgi:lactobin A/cerein 7B family class IIb bacteriocin